MKIKTVNIHEDLWGRMQECMAYTRIFNASEFIRLALEAAVEIMERRYGIVAPVEKQGATPEPKLTNGVPESN